MLPDRRSSPAGPDPRLGSALLVRARNTIARVLGKPLATEPGHPALREPGASFVTLTRNGALRGCIGTLQAHLPLERDVRLRAHSAAFDDPRFAPVNAAEFDEIAIEVSLIGPMEPIESDGLADATRQLQPHVDGVVLAWRDRRATFLPQVWAQLPQPGDFVEALARKAGVDTLAARDEIRLSRYRVDKWREADTSPPSGDDRR